MTFIDAEFTCDGVTGPVLIEIDATPGGRLIQKIKEPNGKLIGELMYAPIDAGGLISEINVAVTGSIFGGPPGLSVGDRRRRDAGR